MFNNPTEGFPWDDLPNFFPGCQQMASVPNGVKTLPKISIAWVGLTNVTDRDDRQQTDDRQTTDGRSLKKPKNLKSPNFRFFRFCKKTWKLHRFKGFHFFFFYRVICLIKVTFKHSSLAGFAVCVPVFVSKMFFRLRRKLFVADFLQAKCDLILRMAVLRVWSRGRIGTTCDDHFRPLEST